MRLAFLLYLEYIGNPTGSSKWKSRKTNTYNYPISRVGWGWRWEWTWGRGRGPIPHWSHPRYLWGKTFFVQFVQLSFPLFVVLNLTLKSILGVPYWKYSAKWHFELIENTAASFKEMLAWKADGRQTSSEVKPGRAGLVLGWGDHLQTEAWCCAGLIVNRFFSHYHSFSLVLKHKGCTYEMLYYFRYALGVCPEPVEVADLLKFSLALFSHWNFKWD